jgi:KUP system potassium uptake protein
MVGLATVATAIASQAVITAAYSLGRQAVQLGLLPRIEVRHTSVEREGQIYLPFVNTNLLLGTVLLVLIFRSSEALASAYGIAFSGLMLLTSCTAFIVFWKIWNWPLLLCGALMCPFVIIDAAFLCANLLKVFEGGWLPVTLAVAICLVMNTWRRGSRALSKKLRHEEFPLVDLVPMLEKRPPFRVPGTAVFLTSNPSNVPASLLEMLRHYKVVHESNVILTVLILPVPRVPIEDRVKIEPIGMTFSRVTLRFEYSARTRHRTKAWLAVRHHVDLVLPVASTA